MEKYRIDKDIDPYYITFTIVEWLPVVFDDSRWRGGEVIARRFAALGPHGPTSQRFVARIAPLRLGVLRKRTVLMAQACQSGLLCDMGDSPQGLER